MRHAVLSRLCLLLAATALCAACSNVRNGYRQDPMALASPEVAPQDDKQLYAELIAKMQQQGAYYASLAHVDAYRQRYGDSPQLRLLNADALRETGQREAALTMYASLTSGPQAAAAWHGLGLVAARDGDAVRAEQALAKAVQLQPLNTG
ncbi:MAG: Flp pilus assembly protein TadD, partial [Stenotrophomonas maltophilia]